MSSIISKPNFCYFNSEFLAPGAKAEINIDGKTMEATKLAMKTPTRFTFEVAASHVYLLLLKKDCYPRFIRSENYKSILANAFNPGNVRRRYVNNSYTCFLKYFKVQWHLPSGGSFFHIKKRKGGKFQKSNFSFTSSVFRSSFTQL